MVDKLKYLIFYYQHGSDFLNENFVFLEKPVAPQSSKARHFSEIRKSDTIFRFITIKKIKRIDNTKASQRVGR